MDTDYIMSGGSKPGRKVVLSLHATLSNNTSSILNPKWFLVSPGVPYGSLTLYSSMMFTLNSPHRRRFIDEFGRCKICAAR